MKFLDKTGLQKVINWVKSKFVTALGTSGNYLTWTRNDTTNNITIPYSTNSGTASKLGSSTVGASNRPIYLNAGIPTVTNPGEGFLSWGGQNISGGVTPIGMALSEEHSANKTAFINGDLVTMEYSSNGGSTWTDYGYSASNKSAFFTTSLGVPIGRANSSTSVVANQSKTRITLTAQNGSDPARRVYTNPKKLLINISSATAPTLLIEYRTGTNYQNNGAWTTFGTYTVSGWSGWNDIPLIMGTLGGGSNQTGNNWQLRLTLTITSVSSSYPTTAYVYGVRIFGENAWSTPSTLAATGHLYSYDMDQNATFPAKVTATSIAKSGGTSSQFLKADGSVDSTIYLPTTKLPVNSNFNANNYTGQSMLYTSVGDVGNRAAGWTNFPTSSAPAGGFSLLNIQEGAYARQIFSCYYEDHIYIRSQHYSNGTTWSDWQKIPLYSDIVTTEFYKEVSGYNIP